MSPRQLLLEQAPQLHFQRVTLGRHSAVEIKKPMVYSFQRERESQMSVHLTFHLRETRHRTNVHEASYSSDSSLTCFPFLQHLRSMRAFGHDGYCRTGSTRFFGCSKSTNCRSYKRR